MKKKQKNLCIAICLLAAFVLWTASVCTIDVQPIGPRKSSVGFASINSFFHECTGVHMLLYTITDWLGLVPLAFIFGFAFLGLKQWIQRKSILKVDFSILILGGFYLIVLAAYILFEEFAINYRPVLIDGFLEVSYPSSTTLLVMCVMPAAMIQLKKRMRNKRLQRCMLISNSVFTAFMIIARLISGVHWLSDIIGSVLFSIGLVMLYAILIQDKETPDPS